MDMVTASDPQAQIIYINKELYEFDFIDNYNALLAYIYSKAEERKNRYVFIDEIQDIGQLKRHCEAFRPRADMTFTAPGVMPDCFPGSWPHI